jgi:integrase
MLYQRGKAKIWWYCFRFGGRMIHESTKSNSRTVARDAERNRRRELEGKWNHIEKRTLPPTFDKAAGEWLKAREETASASNYSELSLNTINSNRVSLKHLLPVFGSMLLCDIEPENVRAYQLSRQRKGAQARTINIEVGVMQQILSGFWFDVAKQAKEKKIRLRLTQGEDVGRALSPDEEKLLLARCATADSACYTATVLALNTTMRKSEIRNLRWRQADLFKSAVTVGKSKTKAGTGREIHLNPAARKALADWGNRFPDRTQDHYVFPWCESRHIDPTKPTQGWRTAWRTVTRAVECPKCGGLQRPADYCQNPECKADLQGINSPLAGLRFHDLRHTAITKLAESQASDQTIMSIAGHVSQAMLEHYSHIRKDARRTALNSISTPLPENAARKMPDFGGCAPKL